MKKFSEIPRPFLVTVIAERSVKLCIDRIDRLEDEVEAFEVNLAPLAVGSSKDIFSSTSRPCIVTNRRSPFMRLYGYQALPVLTEDERARSLRTALGFGASVVDFELDMFDTSTQNGKPDFGSIEELAYARRRNSRPSEFTNRQAAVNGQKALAREVKSTGGEVIISCHTQKKIERRESLSLVAEIRSRGADFAKLVGFTLDDADVSEMISTVAELKKSSAIAFSVMNMGHRPILGRLLSTTFGAAWLYCRPNSKNDFEAQPTISEAKEFLARFLRA